MRTFEIQDGRTLKKQSVHHRTVYPFHKMKVGQSFMVSAADDPRGNKVRSAAYAYASRHEGYRFQVGPEDGGYLVLRVECRPGREKRVPIVQSEAVQEPDVPQATEPARAEVAPLPPHTVMIDGQLAPDPSRPWAAKRVAEFTFADRRAIVELHNQVGLEPLNDEENDVIMEEWEKKNSGQEATTPSEATT
jgi:hypothetical protein